MDQETSDKINQIINIMKDEKISKDEKIERACRITKTLMCEQELALDFILYGQSPSFQKKLQNINGDC